MKDWNNRPIDQLLAIAILPLALTGPTVVGMFPNSRISRGFLLVTVACCCGSLLLRFLANRAWPRQWLGFAAGVVMLVGTYTMCVLAGTYPERAPRGELFAIIGRLCLPMSVFLFSSAQDWSNRRVKWLICVTAISTLTLLTALQIARGAVVGFVAGELHSNMFGMFGVIFVVVGWQFNREHCTGIMLVATRMLIGISILAVLVSNSRAALITILLVFAAYHFLRLIRGFGIGVDAVIVTLVFLCVALPWNLDPILDSQVSLRLSQWSESVFGKPLDTGRENHWYRFKNDIRRSPMFGYGVYSHESYTRKLKNGTTIKLSPHNYFLAIAHEAGFVGVGTICLFLVAIWRAMRHRLDDTGVLLCMAFMVGVMFHQCTEVSLTTGNFLLSSCIWTVLGMGMSRIFLSRSIDGAHVSETSNRSLELSHVGPKP